MKKSSMFVLALIAAGTAQAGLVAPVKVTHGVQLSPDGRWVVYTATNDRPASFIDDASPGETPVELVIRSTQSSTKRSFTVAPSAASPQGVQLSPSGRWLAVQESDGNGSAEQSRLAAIELATGRRVSIAAVRRFSWLASADIDRLVLEGHPAAADSPNFELRIHRMDSGQEEKFAVAGGYKFDASGERLAWVDAKGLQLRDLSQAGSSVQLDTGGRYDHLTWSNNGGGLAALNGTGPATELLVFTGIRTGTARRAAFSASSLSGFPQGYEISSVSAPVSKDYTLASMITWRDDESGVFFGIRPVAAKPASSTEKVANLTLWNWQDPLAPNEKAMLEKRDGRKGYLSYLSLADGRFVRLSDDALRVVDPQSRGAVLLGYDVTPYRRWNHGSNGTFERRDYYCVELDTGARRPIGKSLWITTRRGKGNIPRITPDGSTIVYQDNGDYFAYDTATEARRNLTAGLPTHFYFEEDQRNTRHARDDDGWLNSEPFQGWSDDGSAVLLSDYRDVWALPLKGGTAVNLTGNGRRDDIAYRRTNLRAGAMDFAADSADLKRPLYFVGHDRETGKTGLVRHEPGQSGAAVLRWDDAELSYLKAERAPVLVETREVSDGPTRRVLLNDRFKQVRQLWSDADFGPRQYSPKVRYLVHTGADGRKFHSILAPPRGYTPGKRYPTIVSIYEEQDASPHRPVGSPATLHQYYHQRGYAMLYAAIEPRYNEAGKAALEAVTAAVEAAVATGIADRDCLGLTGYSMGAYNTLIVIAQTNLFKAAIPRAGIADLWSDYGALYGGMYLKYRGNEATQPYMQGPWWDNWQAFLDNSPLYHVRSIQTPLLLVHGTDDDATQFENVFELYASMHRLENKPVVLLEYKGEGHISYNNDAAVRMLQFFDHFLKGVPAPGWWADGLSIPLGQSAALGNAEDATSATGNAKN